ncbi:hypothetical protein ZWY2020_003183 [Hordeum vulgare]|nr:hypothetical protein ZWY2020_003183 [Hordeum vulgare]
MVVGLLASEDGGRLAGARVGHHGAGLLPVVPGPGGGLTGDAEEVLSWIQQPAQGWPGGSCSSSASRPCSSPASTRRYGRPR